MVVRRAFVRGWAWVLWSVVGRVLKEAHWDPLLLVAVGAYSNLPPRFCLVTLGYC